MIQAMKYSIENDLDKPTLHSLYNYSLQFTKDDTKLLYSFRFCRRIFMIYLHDKSDHLEMSEIAI